MTPWTQSTPLPRGGRALLQISSQFFQLALRKIFIIQPFTRGVDPFLEAQYLISFTYQSGFFGTLRREHFPWSSMIGDLGRIDLILPKLPPMLIEHRESVSGFEDTAPRACRTPAASPITP